MLDSQELHFCSISYFSRFQMQSWLGRFHKLVLKFAGEIGQELTHFELWPHDENARSKPYRYIKRNEGRFLEACKENLAKGIDFYSLGADKDFIEAPFAFGMADRKNETGYGIVLFHCNLDLLEASHSRFHFGQELLGDISSLADIRYGLVDVMESRKYPGLYFLDSASSIYLTPEEEQDVARWRKEGSRFETVVRNAYWGNILSSGHWGNDPERGRNLVNEIESECGADISWINERTVFFCAPVDILDHKRKRGEIEAFKRRLLQVYKNHDIEVLAGVP